MTYKSSKVLEQLHNLLSELSGEDNKKEIEEIFDDLVQSEFKDDLLDAVERAGFYVS